MSNVYYSTPKTAKHNYFSFMDLSDDEIVPYLDSKRKQQYEKESLIPSPYLPSF